MNRFSSRHRRLDSRFLTPRLQGAFGYERIAGYRRAVSGMNGANSRSASWS